MFLYSNFESLTVQSIIIIINNDSYTIILNSSNFKPKNTSYLSGDYIGENWCFKPARVYLLLERKTKNAFTYCNFFTLI